ncbi:hypothetical protein NUU61_006043 [Penicillium alfredii]|uniref:DNA endonuclease activator Ctp1 C-terminal domain-containing protein n=1 Tax=Penicillium alfredii TaxID=1506179 RepID=A0A9W9F081_9EURO|nr:uncharacterized protein NUU61_006043 [Penicillium alfredii]KAJ5091173.1 hypothetical protein NUU61_006043 [Penicillium alfredii]
MESPTRPILSPSKALHPVSPERMNQQTIPASPSLPSDLLTLHHKNTKGVSEVQAKVAFLNSLSGEGSAASAQSSAANHAAMQRAVLGREEAESTLATVQEELSEAQARERRISERLESLLEELHGTKERQAHERSIFEKEIRKARKEAFRAGSILVKTQEELKHSKSEVKALKDEVSAERDAKDKAKQDAFERAYALAGLTEELEVLKGKLRSVEANNHSSTLEVRAHEIRKEDFGRLSLAEGDLAFLTTPRRPKRAAAGSVRSPAPEVEPSEIAEATPPKRQRLSDCVPQREESDVEPVTSLSDTEQDVLDDLTEKLEHEKRRRVEAEEMVHFLNIECQFERCSCRIAESQGRRYIYDAEYFEKFQKPQLEAAQQASAQQIDPGPTRTPDASPPTPVHQQLEPVVKAEPADPPETMQMPAEPLVTFSPETGTFKTFPSPLRDDVRPLRMESFGTSEEVELQANDHRDSVIESHTPSGEPMRARISRATPSDVAIHDHMDAPMSREARPTRRAERENYDDHHSASQRVPLRREEESRGSFQGTVPDTPINREEALAQIRARRGRARSKQRSVSANEAGRAARAGGSSGGSNATPARGPRHIPNLRADSKSENDLGERRDLSAPVRMFRR